MEIWILQSVHKDNQQQSYLIEESEQELISDGEDIEEI
jgi:hypothetical protein